MKKLLVVAALALMTACAGVPSAKSAVAKSVIPSARCADEVANVITGTIADPANIMDCFSAEGKAGYRIKTKADFDLFLTTNASPSFFMGHGCGEYAGDKFGVDFLRGLYVYAYSVTIDPSSYPTVFPHSMLAIGLNKAGLVVVIAHLSNSPTECPFDKPGATPS